jgi:hypothetical protein
MVAAQRTRDRKGIAEFFILSETSDISDIGVSVFIFFRAKTHAKIL